MKKSKANIFVATYLPEVLLVIFTFTTWLFAYVNGFQFFGPNSKITLMTMLFPSYFFYRGAFAGIAAIMLVNIFHKEKKGRFLRAFGNLAFVLRLFVLMTASLYFYINIKWWSHLVRNTSYDDILYLIDINIFPWLIRACNSIAGAIENITGPGDAYAGAFFLMFFVIVGIASFQGRRSVGLVIYTICLVLFFGSFLYCLLPSYGPFVHGVSPQNHYKPMQIVMLGGTLLYKRTGNYMDVAHIFDCALGAMPSLHIAHVVALFQACFIIKRRWAWFLLPIIPYIFIYAVVSQFHYVSDLIAGILLAWAIYPLQKYIYRLTSPEVKQDEKG